jgi:hypothetical protein
MADWGNIGSTRRYITNQERRSKLMHTLKILVLRIVAVFGSSALAAVAGGAVLNVELWKAAAIAGIVAAARVTESLLRAWASDGILTKEEIAEAFGKVK